MEGILLLVLCGKFCTGKDTIQKEILKMGMNPVVSYTTRPRREDEQNGVKCHFITKDEFFRKERQGFLAGMTSYKVATGDFWHYGYALGDLTDDKAIIMNPYGLKQLRKLDCLNLVVFYITARDTTVLERARQRGDEPEEILRRMGQDVEDFVDIDREVDFVFSNDLGLSPELIAEMIFYTYRKATGYQAG